MWETRPGNAQLLWAVHQDLPGQSGPKILKGNVLSQNDVSIFRLWLLGYSLKAVDTIGNYSQ